MSKQHMCTRVPVQYGQDTYVMSRIWLFRLYPVFTEIVSESDFWRWTRTSCVGSVGRSAFETPVLCPMCYEGNTMT